MFVWSVNYPKVGVRVNDYRFEVSLVEQGGIGEVPTDIWHLETVREAKAFGQLLLVQGKNGWEIEIHDSRTGRLAWCGRKVGPGVIKDITKEEEEKMYHV